MQQQDLSFIKQQADQWLVKMETNSMTDGDETRFVEWMEQDERHGQAFYEAEQTWQLMHQATKSAQAQIKTATISKFRQVFMPLAASVVLTLSSLLWWQDIYFATISDHYTVTGQRLSQELSDGSELILNTDSAVDVEFNDNARVVKVLSGEVYVVVAKDTKRPFTVEVGNMKVTALGTEFIVRTDHNLQPTVTVTEHSVKIESDQNKNLNLVLEQGQQVSLNENTAKPSQVKNVDIDAAQSWRNGKYVFKEEALARVLQELDRYYEGKIVLRGDELQEQKVTGVLNLEEPRTSLENLTRSLSLKVSSVTPYLLLVEQG